MTHAINGQIPANHPCPYGDEGGNHSCDSSECTNKGKHPLTRYCGWAHLFYLESLGKPAEGMRVMKPMYRFTIQWRHRSNQGHETVEALGVSDAYEQVKAKHPGALLSVVRSVQCQ